MSFKSMIIAFGEMQMKSQAEASENSNAPDLGSLTNIMAEFNLEMAAQHHEAVANGCETAVTATSDPFDTMPLISVDVDALY